jgi:hypothetical protein
MLGGRLLLALYPKKDVRMELMTLVTEGCPAQSGQESDIAEHYPMAQNDELNYFI